MAMFQMGMDTTATARIADELVQQGRECETARLEAGRAIQRLVTQWGGRDFEEARREWRQNDTALREAAAHLSKMGETLRRNVQAQTQSSEADADGTAGGDGSSDKRDLPPGSKTGDYDSEGPRNLDPKVTEAWNKMSRPEQEQWMRNYARELGRKYGLPDFKVTFNQSNNYGSWDPNNRVLNVNPAYFNDPRETIDTVAHEMRHAMRQ